MNTANLQLEGVYAALTALVTALREKNLLSEAEIDAALAAAEQGIAAEAARPSELSGANIDAICFPLRFLRLANQRSSSGQSVSFMQLAAEVGRTKPDHQAAAPRR